MKTLMLAVCAVGFLLATYGFVDAIERDNEARLAYHAALHEDCIPKTGQTAVIVSDGQRVHCRLYSSASTHTGMVPQLISAAVLEAPL